MRIFKPRQQAIVLALTLIVQPTMAGNVLPSGGTVVSGAANISQSGANQVINQTTGKAIINWQDFSIGAGNSVRVNQPNSSSILLNRVVGGNPSNILGNLSSNGQVFLVNPFGVYFGAGATVDVGGLLATTLNIGNDDFMAGRFIFNRNSLTDARREVINQGVLKARDNGYIVLAGDYAANRGVIQAKLGTVALASGNQMTLDIQGDNLIAVAVNEKTVASLSGVDNSGQILADGGRAIMTASVARDLTTAAVNNSGLIQAQTAVEKNGEIYLSSDGGNTLNSGTLDASGKATGQTGGTIKVLGEKVALTEHALLDASGDAGGGKINVGGNFQGIGPLTNAQTNYVGKNVQIKADALNNGNGGNVVIWSDDWTRYYGSISAQGGAQGGDGGNVEVSGKQTLSYDGLTNTLASKGKTGTLLLDPTDINIGNGVVAGDITPTGGVFEGGSANTSRLSVGALESALDTSNVTIKTTSSGSAPNGGTITIDDGGGDGIQWNKPNTLHLQADNKIVINSAVEGTDAASTLWLQAANGATQAANTHLQAGSLLMTGGGYWDLAGVASTTSVNSHNDFNTVAADISGNSLVRFSNAKNFTVGTVTGTGGDGTTRTVSGFNHANGETRLYLDRPGSINVAQNITSSVLLIRANSGINQTGGTVTATSLALSSSGGGATFNQLANNVGSLSANLNGALSYKTSNTLKIGSASGVSGITTNNHDVTINTGNSTSFDATKQPNATNPASLVLNETVNAGNGTVRLTVGQGGVYQRHDVNSSGTPLDNGAIKAAGLLMKGNSSTVVTPYVLTNANNRINTLAGTINGSINYAGTAYSGTTTTVGTISSINGLSTTSNSIVSSTTNSDGSVTNSYNPNDISLSIGGNLNINQNITASTTNGSDSVSIGIGGDYTAKTAAGVRITADTLGVFGDDSKGSFYLKSKVSNIAASGGKLMVIDNSDYTGSLTALGIGANSSGDIDDAIAVGAAAINGGSATVTSSDKPVGDFYLTTGGALSIIKLNSKGRNLMLRSTALDILLTATTADNARIMLQPFDLTNKIGINNATEPGFTPDINYDAATLLKFNNPVSTFYIGTPQESIMADANVPTAAKNTLSGDVHIGYDGAFNLGYRSLSAQTTGNMIAYNVGPLYNLRLAAPNLTINSFNTIGDQMHFFSNNLSLPSATSAYVNANKPKITLRTLNDQTVWIGQSHVANEPQILPSTIVKLPDGSTIIISGTNYYPFPNGGAGYHDIHIPWDDGINLLGNRKLVLSTGHRIYTYNATPLHTEFSADIRNLNSNGGTSGGLWRGCENLSDCMGSNPSPYPNPDTGFNGGGGGGGDDGSGGYTPCADCPSAPPTVNPYPPTTSTPGDNGNTNGNGNNNNGNNNNTNNDGNNNNNNGNNNGSNDNNGNNNNGNNSSNDGGGGDGGGFSSGGGDGDGSNNNSTNGDGNGNGTGGDGSNTSGSGGGGDGNGSNGSGLNGDGSGNGGDGGGDGGGSMSGGGNGDGSDGNGSGANSGGTGSGGDGNGSDGSGNGNDGSNNDGSGGGDGGASSGSGGDGDGSGGNGNGNNGNGTGDGGDGSGSGGDGNGDGDSGAGGNGSGNGGDGGGDGGASTGSGGDGDGSGGNGNGNNGDSSGDGSDGSGSGGAADGDGGNGSGQNGDGNGGGDGGNDTDSGGSADGAGSNNGDSGNGNQNTDETNGGSGKGNGDGNGDAGAGAGSGGKSDGDSDGSDGKSQKDGNDQGAEQAPSFDISCDDLQQDTKKQVPKASAQANGEMVAIKRDGVKMHTPCQKENPKDKK